MIESIYNDDTNFQKHFKTVIHDKRKKNYLDIYLEIKTVR